jgi:hypothetical protein
MNEVPPPCGRIGSVLIMPQMRREEAGALSPVTLSAKYQLAYAYRTAGRFYRAIHLFERVAADRSRTLGADHPGHVDRRAQPRLRVPDSGAGR